MSKSSIICQIRQQKADGVSHFRRDGRRFYRSSHTRKNIKAFAVGMVRGPAGELRLNMLGDRRLPKRVKRRNTRREHMFSALPPPTDMWRLHRDVRFVPCVDGSELARAFFTFCSIGRCSHVFGLLMRFT